MRSPYNPNGIAIGDTVRVRPYRSQTMSGLWVDGFKSHREGMVTGLIAGDSWHDAPTKAVIRVLLESGQHAMSIRHELRDLDLLIKGDGTFELGRTQPYSGAELRAQRLAAFEFRLASVDTRYQGFSNAATFLAHLYLCQTQAAVRAIDSLRRVDGSLNPDRLEKVFYRQRLQIDGWALAPVLPVPEEFRHWAHRWRQRVNWPEVADAFQIGAIL